MKRNLLIFFIASIIVILPVIAIGILYLFWSKNLFDNPDFWYGYMAYFGTTCLAIVSLWQNENANIINERLNELQKNEYTPNLIVTGLLGIYYFKENYSNIKNKNDIFVTEMRTKDNDIQLGYGVCLIDDDFSDAKYIIPRTYIINLKSVSKSLITKIELKSISFIGAEFQKVYAINKTLDISINDNDELKLFIYHFLNINNHNRNSFLYCRKMRFNILIYTSLNKVFKETITVDKHFIKNYVEGWFKGNIELMVSSSFEIEEILKKRKKKFELVQGINKLKGGV